MTKSKQLKLIEGRFSYVDAKEILTNIFSAKINFHQLKNFSFQERFGKEDPVAQKRIPALKKEMAKLEKILSEAKAKQKALVISSEINISLSGDE